MNITYRVFQLGLQNLLFQNDVDDDGGDDGDDADDADDDDGDDVLGVWDWGSQMMTVEKHCKGMLSSGHSGEPL